MSIKVTPIKELPKVERRGRGSEYDNVIEQFLKGEAKYAEIAKEGVTSMSLASALRGRINKKKLTDKIKVRQIKKKIYLEKL